MHRVCENLQELTVQSYKFVYYTNLIVEILYYRLSKALCPSGQLNSGDDPGRDRLKFTNVEEQLQ